MLFRKIYFIDKRLQTRFILSFVLIVILWAAATVGIYMFLVAKKLDTIRYSSHIDIKTTGDLLMPITLGTHLVSLAVFAVILAVAMKTIWKVLSPPLYSLKKDLARIAAGDLTSEISLCKGEEFQDLAGELEKMRQKLRENILQVKDQQQALAAAAREIDSAVTAGNLSRSQVAALQAEISRMKEFAQTFRY